MGCGLAFGLKIGLPLALGFGLVLALGFGLLETQSVLITSRTPKEARSRSLTAALTWLMSHNLMERVPHQGTVGQPTTISTRWNSLISV